MDNDFDLIIEPNKDVKGYWKEIWRFRELFYFLAWRDILVRYKQTTIGIAWSVIRPFLTMIVFTIVFGKIAKLPAQGIPYPLLVFSALLPWQMFTSSLSESGNSLLANTGVISKVYFPRVIIPASTIIVGFVDFIISFFLLICLMVWYRYFPGMQFLLLPFFVSLALFIALGSGLWISALSVKYRDFRYVVPFLIQIGLYISPVGFSSEVIPDKWRFIYSLNPMVGVIEGFRWSILGGEYKLDMLGFSLSIFLAILIFVSSIIYFRKTERIFSDII